MVQLLIKKDFTGFASKVPTTVKECYKTGVPMVIVNQVTPVRPQIEYELFKAADMLNIDSRLTIQPHQLPEISQMIYDEWKTLSLEDVTLALRRLVRGYYGEIFRLDAAVITKALQGYSEELATLQELGLQQQAKEYEDIDYEAFKKKLAEQREKQNRVDERKRESRIQEIQAREAKLSEFQTTEEEMILKQKRIEWSREYHHIDRLPPNNKKENWISFDEFLQKPSNQAENG